MADVVRDPKCILSRCSATSRPGPVCRTFTLSQVALVYGSRWKQRYFEKRSPNYYYPLPAQWDIEHRKWLPYHVPDGADLVDSLLRQGKCLTVLRVPPAMAATPSTTTWPLARSQNERRMRQMYGPGSEHVAHPAAKAS